MQIFCLFLLLLNCPHYRKVLFKKKKTRGRKPATKLTGNELAYKGKNYKNLEKKGRNKNKPKQQEKIKGTITHIINQKMNLHSEQKEKQSIPTKNFK